MSIDPETLIEAARLVDAITARVEQDANAFEFAFKLGYHHGYQVGWAHGARDQHDWFRVDRDGYRPRDPALQREMRQVVEDDVAAYIEWKYDRARRHPAYVAWEQAGKPREQWEEDPEWPDWRDLAAREASA